MLRFVSVVDLCDYIVIIRTCAFIFVLLVVQRAVHASITCSVNIANMVVCNESRVGLWLWMLVVL